MIKIYSINGQTFLTFENKLFGEVQGELLDDPGKTAAIEPVEKRKYKTRKKAKGGGLKKGKKGKGTVSEEIFGEMLKEVSGGRSVADVCEEFEMKVSAFYARRNYLKKKGTLPAGEEKADGNQKYNYVCRGCGFKFTSVIPPREIKCPDCKAKPVLAEEKNL